MTQLVGIIAPVFALILLGAVAGWRRLIEPAGFRGINDIVFFAGLPCLLFLAVTDAPPLRLADVAGAFLSACILLFAAMVVLARTGWGVGLARASIFGINSVFGNTVMLGIPVVSAAYGTEGLVDLLAIVAFHSAVLLPMASALIEADAAAGRSAFRVMWGVVPGALRNPIVVSILLAFAWREGGVALPEAVHRFLALVAPAGPPLALFCLGGSLPRPQGLSGLREMAFATIAKLAVLPVLAGGVAYLVGVEGIAFKVVVLTAGLPTGANAFLLARRSEMLAEASAGTVLASTALSVVTLSVLLQWLG